MMKHSSCHSSFQDLVAKEKNLVALEKFSRIGICIRCNFMPWFKLIIFSEIVTKQILLPLVLCCREENIQCHSCVEKKDRQ